MSISDLSWCSCLDSFSFCFDFDIKGLSTFDAFGTCCIVLWTDVEFYMIPPLEFRGQGLCLSLSRMYIYIHTYFKYVVSQCSKKRGPPEFWLEFMMLLKVNPAPWVAKLWGHNKHPHLRRRAECPEWAAWTLKKGWVAEKTPWKRLPRSKYLTVWGSSPSPWLAPLQASSYSDN